MDDEPHCRLEHHRQQCEQLDRARARLGVRPADQPELNRDREARERFADETDDSPSFCVIRQQFDHGLAQSRGEGKVGLVEAKMVGPVCRSGMHERLRRQFCVNPTQEVQGDSCGIFRDVRVRVQVKHGDSDPSSEAGIHGHFRPPAFDFQKAPM